MVALQFVHAGVGIAAMQTLPWAFVPTVLVPVFLIAHAIIFMRIHTGSLDAPDQRPVSIRELDHGALPDGRSGTRGSAGGD
jgi:hypothetical protein